MNTTSYGPAMTAPFYNVARGGVFTDDGTDCQTKAISDALHTKQRAVYERDDQPVTVVVSEADAQDPRHSEKALLAYERVRSILMLGYPEPGANYDPTIGFDYRVTDLIADVMHFCEIDGMEFDALCTSAGTHWRDERDPSYDA